MPDVPGGTEVYVASLARELAVQGIASLIVSPTTAPMDTSYAVDGIPVHRVSVSPKPRPLASLYGQGDARFSRGLMDVVTSEHPDVVHFHAYSPAINGALAKAVRGAGPAIVATYHTPSVTCQRGTLLRFGHIVCDGRMQVGRCASCVLEHNGVPRPAADLVGRVPNAVGRALVSRGMEGGVWTALQMSELIRLRHDDTRTFFDAADVVVAVAEWVRTLLIENGIDERKITLSPHGVSAGFAAGRAERPPLDAERPLRAVMLGRVDEMKGMDLPLAAMARRRDLQVSLDVYGSVQSESDYVTAFRARVENDPRVRLLPPLRPDAVVRAIADYDVLLVPSQVLETGPLVVLEAHAAGVPVIGTALGGIAERVRDGVDGRLVAPRSVAGWEEVLCAVVRDRSIVERWRRAVLPPRTMGRVAEEMIAIYQGLGTDRRVSSEES